MLYDIKGNRKYLTSKERRAFLGALRSKKPEVRSFCTVLVYTGARISEVLALSPSRIDCIEKGIVLETLKKRRRGIFRVVPVPGHVLRLLQATHDIVATPAPDVRLWKWGRTTAWRRVKEVMREAGISESLAKPKALRHAFGVNATQTGISLNLLKRWLGHSRLETTAIYADVLGEEERQAAMRMWQ